jgi:protein TonB
MKTLLRAAGLMARLAAATLGAFALFVAISMLHSLFGVEHKLAGKSPEQRRIQTEVVRQEKPRPVQERASRVRQVSAAGPGSRAAHISPMAMKFDPDLGAAGSGEGVEVEAAQEMTVEVFEEGQTDEDAVPVIRPAPAYPDRAKELGIEGELAVVLIVNEDGKVSSVEVVESPHPSITAQARKTFAAWRFKPAYNKGVPVKQRIKQRIEYRLD